MTDPTRLSVRGEAASEVLADHAHITVQVRREDVDRELATSAAGEVASAVRTALDGTGGIRRSTFSRLMVREVSEWDERTRTNQRRAWEASLGGTVDAEADAVGEVSGLLVEAGAEVLDVGWHVDDSNAVHAQVRRDAVAAAARAAEDFAAALGGKLGELVELADSGLLSQGPSMQGRAPGMPMAALARGGGLGPVELDPQLMTVRAVVEARYLLADT